MRSFIALLLLTFLAQSAWAQQVFVRNKPFTGATNGTLSSIDSVQLELRPLVDALGLVLHEVDGVWQVMPPGREPNIPPGTAKGTLYVGKFAYPYVKSGDQMLVGLKDFAHLVGAKVNYHKDLGTLDVYYVASPTAKGPADHWGVGSGGGWKLICFGAEDAPAWTRFRPILKNFQKKVPVPVIYVNVRQKASENYKAYIYLYAGTFIPHTVLVNEEMRPVKRWTGYVPLEKFTKEVQAALH